MDVFDKFKEYLAKFIKQAFKDSPLSYSKISEVEGINLTPQKMNMNKPLPDNDLTKIIENYGYIVIPVIVPKADKTTIQILAEKTEKSVSELYQQIKENHVKYNTNTEELSYLSFLGLFERSDKDIKADIGDEIDLEMN